MKRLEIVSSIIDLLEDGEQITPEIIDLVDVKVRSIIDEIEQDIVRAKDHLSNINGIDNLDSVSDCYSELDSICNDLYW